MYKYIHIRARGAQGGWFVKSDTAFSIYFITLLVFELTPSDVGVHRSFTNNQTYEQPSNQGKFSWDVRVSVKAYRSWRAFIADLGEF